MKIILCLSLIMLGVSSMVRYRNQRKKEKRDIVNKVIDNHIIAKSAKKAIYKIGKHRLYKNL